MTIILASGSERRQELLKRIIKDFNVMVSDFDENSIAFEGDCIEYVKKLSLGKAQTIANKVEFSSLVIGCDTIVYHKDRVLGKPKNEEEAFDMLMSISGDKHKVFSGISIIDTNTNKIVQDYVSTEVYFSKLSKEQIDKYIKSGEPMDKAGAYGIQGYGGIFVEKIHGCYYNVVGLPLSKLCFLLRDMGVNL